MHQLLTAQYGLIKGARLALLDYCATMDAADLHKAVASFNNNTIAGMLIHNANTYIHWLVKFDQGNSVPYFSNNENTTIDDIRSIYNQVDAAVDQFLQKYTADYMLPQTKEIPGKGLVLTTNPLELFTHAATHEFHHKGQILTATRLLGYTPVDTDVIRY